jgi:plasmid stabilization system protein ParE
VKRIVISLEAEAALDDILIHTIERWSQAQAEIYIGQLTQRLRALASGAPPHARPCELLMQGKRTATGLSYYREGSLSWYYAKPLTNCSSLKSFMSE